MEGSDRGDLEMPIGTFDQDRKYCPKCKAYVSYLVSIQASYCIECGTRVELFDPAATKAFQEHLERANTRREF